MVEPLVVPEVVEPLVVLISVPLVVPEPEGVVLVEEHDERAAPALNSTASTRTDQVAF